MIAIRRFRPEDQEPVRSLVLAGLREHWGQLDESMNPDLLDIHAAYAQGTFLVAWSGEQIVGTGAFIPCSADTVEIVRMSVAKAWRRQGIGRKILAALCRSAYQAGYQVAILETTTTWQDAISFYEHFGFRRTHKVGDDVYFRLVLSALE